MSATAIAPAELATRIMTAWASSLERTRRPQSPHPTVWASAWRTCDRRMVLELTQPEAIPAFPANVLAKFRRGDDRERDLLSDLARIGRDSDPPFKVIGQQERFALRDRQGREAISGKVDARLQVNGSNAPLEVKAWSANLVDRIERFEDLFDNVWTRSGAYQLLSYLFGAGEPFGFLLLDRSGLPALIPVELEPHLDRVEAFLTRAERVLDHRAAETLPDFLVGDRAECQRCPFFGSICNPPTDAVGAVVLTDPAIEQDLERWHAIKEIGKEFERLDGTLKKRLRGIEHGVAGAFSISGKWGTHSRVELPDDLKKRYTVKDPKGKFTLEVARLSDSAPTTEVA
jgi:hypothetical protein